MKKPPRTKGSTRRRCIENQELIQTHGCNQVVAFWRKGVAFLDKGYTAQQPKLSPIKRTVGRYKNPCFRTLSDAESLILDTDQDKILQSGQLFTGDADYHSRIEVAVR